MCCKAGSFPTDAELFNCFLSASATNATSATSAAVLHEPELDVNGALLKVADCLVQPQLQTHGCCVLDDVLHGLFGMRKLPSS